jgi:hypothetical protein
MYLISLLVSYLVSCLVGCLIGYLCRLSFSLSARYTVKPHLLSRLPLYVCARVYWTETEGRHCATVQLRLNELTVVRKDLRCSGSDLSYL